MSSDHLGIACCLVATLIFACQDALTKILVNTVPAPMFIMARFWVFLLFALVFAHYNGGIHNAVKSKRPVIQAARGCLLIIQIVIFAIGLKYLSLADMHALFVIYPIFVTLMAVPLLNETLGWHRIVAVCASFAGALIILRPGTGIFGPESLLPISCAILFAIYNVLTRMTSRYDHYSSNILYVAVIGALVSTAWGMPLWQAPDPAEAMLMTALCFTGVAGHVTLMKALEYADASSIQPFNYFTLVWAILISVLYFNQWPDYGTVTGAVVIICSGLFVIKRTQMKKTTLESAGGQGR